MTRILVIDDEHSIRQILLIHLQGAGFEVLSAETATAGLEMLAGGVDLVICDMQLPDMHGLEAVSRIRALSERLPVLAMSGFMDADVLDNAVAAGASDVLRKPFLKETLLKTVDRLLAA